MEKMNPWISIWTEPRKTIAQIVATNPNRGLWLLAWIYGFLSLLNGGQSLTVGNHFHVLLILVFSVVVAPFWGMFVFWIWTWAVLLIGKILKGQADFTAARAAFAWSCVPLIVNIVLWILMLLVIGGALFQTAQPTQGPMVFLTAVLIAKLAVMIWSLVIYINALAEVQKFSVARSVANIVLAWIALGIVITIVFLGVWYLFHASFPPSQAVFNLTFRG